MKISVRPESALEEVEPGVEYRLIPQKAVRLGILLPEKHEEVMLLCAGFVSFKLPRTRACNVMVQAEGDRLRIREVSKENQPPLSMPSTWIYITPPFNKIAVGSYPVLAFTLRNGEGFIPPFNTFAAFEYRGIWIVSGSTRWLKRLCA